MVSVLPGERGPWDVIGKAIGHNLSSTLPGAVQQGFQRQTGLNAIDQLQQQLGQSGGDINQILPALAKAYTLNPSLERSGLGQTYLQQAQRTRGAGEFPAGGHPVKKVEGAKGQQPQEVPVSVSDLVQARPSAVQNPQGISDFQLPYGPEEIANIRQKARERGYAPEMEERFVQDAVEFNKIATNRREAELSNYQQQQRQREDTIKNQAEFEKYLVSHSPEFGNNPDELELALKASEKYQNEPSFAARNAKVKEELRPYQAAKQALDKGLKRPLFGQTKEQRKLSRPRARVMVEMGQKPQLQLMIAKNGNGEVEEADLLNPLPEQFENNLEKFNKFIKPLEVVTNIDPDSPEYQKQLDLGIKKRQSQINHMTDFLSENIIPGTYKDPGTNLLLTRAHLMNKGLQYDEAANAIDTAIDQGKIKLDPQQKIDYQKLAYPPLTGDTYFDTIMNNLLFPITGKQ